MSSDDPGQGGTMAAIVPGLRVGNVLLVGLLAGVLVGILMVETALLEVPASVYTAVQKPKHEIFEPIAVVYALIVVSGIIVLALSRREFRTAAFALTVAGMLCLMASIVTTLLVNVPINAEIMETWSVAHPPADWAEVRDRWNLFHTIRTALNAVAFLCLLLAATSSRNRARA
jgi:uncharacterized membrane protein